MSSSPTIRDATPDDLPEIAALIDELAAYEELAHEAVATRSRADADDVLVRLREGGYRVADLTQSELAKLHIRYMVGGRSHDVGRERICRFEFPERPGALLQFLDTLGGRWNISLFHYRNHGADVGRVLAGFEVPPHEREEFRAFLELLGYPAQDEVGNPAYDAFLRRGRVEG